MAATMGRNLPALRKLSQVLFAGYGSTGRKKCLHGFLTPVSCPSCQQKCLLRTSIGPLRHGDYEYRDPQSEDEVVNITYITKDGERIPIKGKVGDNVMYLAHRYEIPIEGACEASLACCTCHVYVHDDYQDRIHEATEEEEDMLDMAPFLRESSRLSCQITLSKDLDGIEVTLPQATRNFYVDGHVPEPH